MRKGILRIIAVTLTAAALVSLFACGDGKPAEQTEKLTGTESKKEETTMEEMTETVTETQAPEPAAIYPEEGSVVSLLNDQMTEWLKKYKKGKLDKTCDYTEKCEPVPVCFSWGENADYTHLLISEKADMSDPSIFLCTGDSLEVEDLLPGTEYFWQTVGSKDGEKVRSEVHSFKTLQTPRTVYIPGVSNVRDLGGKITSSGKRVKYGMVYRGADFAHLTDEGIKKAVDILGIKTELDLRNRIANGKSPLGDGVKYISVTAPYYGLIADQSYKEDLLTELRVFADAGNYPVYFHCSLGRDRTGTLAFLLLALLGAKPDDIFADYEISFFSDIGGYVDTTAPSYMVQQLDATRTMVSSSVKKLETNTRAYLIGLGMTEEELDAIRANLLEDVQ